MVIMLFWVWLVPYKLRARSVYISLQVSMNKGLLKIIVKLIAT